MKKTAIFFVALFAATLLSGCAKKYKLSRDEKIPISNPWQFSRKNLEARADIKSNFKGKLNLIWETKVSEGPVGPMTIGVDKLIYCGTKRRAYFFETETGKNRGVYRAKRNIQTGVIVVDSLAYLYEGPVKNEFLCVNLYNRKTVWSKHLKDVSGGPIIIDNHIYIGSGPDELYCLDRMTGNVIWKNETDGKNLAGPSGNEEIVYFPFDNGEVAGYSTLRGDMIFKTDLEQPLVAKAVVGNYLFITGSEGMISAIDREKGQVIWEKEFSYPIWTTPALDDGILYLGDNGGIFRALLASDGTTIWEFRAEGVIVASAIVVGDYVLFGSLDRHLYCLDKKSGDLISKREFKYGISISPISDGKRIFVAAQDGTIQCFGN